MNIAGIGDNSYRNQRIFRSNPDTGYTKLANAFLQDGRLSYETRGLLAELMSRPDDWEIRAETIVKSGPAGRDKVWRMLREAEQFGYAVAQQSRAAETGKFNKCEYVITDDPKMLIERAAREIESMISPLTEKPGADILPFPENPCTAGEENVGNKGDSSAHWKAVHGKSPLTGSPCTANRSHTKERYIQTTETTLEGARESRITKAAAGIALGFAAAASAMPAAAAPMEPPAIVQPVKLSLAEMTDRMMDAAGNAIANPAGAMGLLTFSELQRWLADGCDFETDILQTIRAASVKMSRSKPGSIGSWKFFTNAIADAKAARLAPMPAGRARAAGFTPPDRDQQRAESWLDREIAEAKRKGEIA